VGEGGSGKGEMWRWKEDGMPNHTHMYIHTCTSQPQCRTTYDWRRSRPSGTPCRLILGEGSHDRESETHK